MQDSNLNGLSRDSNGNEAVQSINTTPVQQESGQFSEHSSSNQDTQSRCIYSRENVNSPNLSLEFFASAKSKIIHIFTNLLEIAKECENIERALHSNSEELTLITEKIEFIKSSSAILEKNKMKVVFFGATSSGKSTVINAMLGTNILPIGNGSTTSCFVQVEGSDSTEGCLYTMDSDQPQNINMINTLGDAMDPKCFKGNSLIKICYPKEKCRLLEEDVVLVDSPGIYREKKVDDWIKEVCRDADVFVLVTNSELCLSQTEIRFCVELGMPMPKIFILQNKWNHSDDTPRAKLVKQHNYQTSMHFLTEELKVASEKEAEQRIFFVSAKEVLETRQQKECTTPITGYPARTNYSEGNHQFKNFENKFETCISKTAVKTKLKQYGLKGEKMANFFKRIFDNWRIAEKINETKETFRTNETKIQELDSLITQNKKNIQENKEKIKKQVAIAVWDIVEILPKYISSLGRPYPEDLNDDYKRGLNAYLEDCVNQDIQQNCSSLLQEIQNKAEETNSKIALLLPADKHAELNQIMTELDIEIDCGQYIRDQLDMFREDLDFEFLNLENFPGAAGGVSAGTAGFFGLRFIGTELLGASIGVLPAVAVSLPLTAATIGGYFGYKAYKWIKTEKYEAYLQQYSDHATNTLSSYVEDISSDLSDKVHKKLSQTHKDLQILVNKHKEDLTKRIRDLDKILENLEGLPLKVMELREKLVEIDKELEKFIKDYFPTSETP